MLTRTRMEVVFLNGSAATRRNDLQAHLDNGWRFLTVEGDFAYLAREETLPEAPVNAAGSVAPATPTRTTPEPSAKRPAPQLGGRKGR